MYFEVDEDDGRKSVRACVCGFQGAHDVQTREPDDLGLTQPGAPQVWPAHCCEPSMLRCLHARLPPPPTYAHRNDPAAAGRAVAWSFESGAES